MKLSSRWLPAIIAPVVVIAGAIAVPAIANADSPLPEKSAADVLAMVADSDGVAYSGQITLTSNLGLPDLGSVGSPVQAGDGADDSVTSIVQLLTGSHDLRVYTNGSTGQRIQVLDSLAERDLIRNGTDVWAYDSAKNTADHLSAAGAQGQTQKPAPTTDPTDVARRFIDGVTPYTTVSVTTTDKVAGRSVYELQLTPTSDTTLVRGVQVAVDSQTGLPLKVEVDSASGPAATIAFSSIDFSSPDASLFTFTPPAGATVTEVTPPQKGAPDAQASHPKPTVSGTGWDTIVELPAGTVDLSTIAGDQSGMLNELTTQVGDGRAFETSVVTVLVTGDGRVFAGAVPLSALEAAAS